MTVRDMLMASAGSNGGDRDSYFSNVSLLLHGDGTNGAQNNTFIDSSPNNFTITRNGNTTQGSFSPFSKEPGKWGVAFKATTDWLTVGSTTALNMGTGDFTVEAWVNGGPNSVGSVLASNNATWSAGAVVFFINDSETRLAAYDYSASGMFLYGPSGVKAGEWKHVAVVRSGNSMQIFVNGVGGAAVTVSSSLNINFNTNGNTNIGRNPWDGSGGYLTGNLSNLRVVKGTALYTANFTPPTAPLTAVAGTSLLCCQDNRFKDNSANNFTLTPYGNVAVTPFSPFANSAAWSASVNGGSGYFDGSGDYLVTSSSFPAIGKGDYCINFWTYPQRTSPFAGVFELGTYATGLLVRATPGYGVEVFINGTQVVTRDVLKQNAWNYVCIFRESNWTYIFVNGVQELASTAHSGLSVSSFPAKIGTTEHSGYIENQYGYLCDLRVNVGTTSIANQLRDPPTAPISGVSNTQLFTKFQNAAIFDNAMMNDLKTVNNAQISTSVKKYGTGSMAFDGNGYVLAPHNDVYNFGAGDFTIEGWLNFNSLSDASYQSAVGKWFGSSNYGWLVSFKLSNIYFFSANNGNSIANTLSGAWTAITGSWFHFAVTRSSGTVRFFINGNQVLTNSNTNNITTTAGNLGVGCNPDGNIEQFNGYIDDLCITKGVARYTANFTPPAQAFPNK